MVSLDEFKRLESVIGRFNVGTLLGLAGLLAYVGWGVGWMFPVLMMVIMFGLCVFVMARMFGGHGHSSAADVHAVAAGKCPHWRASPGEGGSVRQRLR